MPAAGCPAPPDEVDHDHDDDDVDHHDDDSPRPTSPTSTVSRLLRWTLGEELISALFLFTSGEEKFLKGEEMVRRLSSGEEIGDQLLLLDSTSMLRRLANGDPERNKISIRTWWGVGHVIQTQDWSYRGGTWLPALPWGRLGALLALMLMLMMTLEAARRVQLTFPAWHLQSALALSYLWSIMIIMVKAIA